MLQSHMAIGKHGVSFPKQLSLTVLTVSHMYEVYRAHEGHVGGLPGAPRSGVLVHVRFTKPSSSDFHLCQSCATLIQPQNLNIHQSSWTLQWIRNYYWYVLLINVTFC